MTISVSAAPDPFYDADRWWQDEYSLVAVFSEVIKLAFYWAKYGIAPVGIWPAPRPKPLLSLALIGLGVTYLLWKHRTAW